MQGQVWSILVGGEVFVLSRVKLSFTPSTLFQVLGPVVASEFVGVRCTAVELGQKQDRHLQNNDK